MGGAGWVGKYSLNYLKQKGFARLKMNCLFQRYKKTPAECGWSLFVRKEK